MLGLGTVWWDRGIGGYVCPLVPLRSIRFRLGGIRGYVPGIRFLRFFALDPRMGIPLLTLFNAFSAFLFLRGGCGVNTTVARIAVLPIRQMLLAMATAFVLIRLEWMCRKDPPPVRQPLLARPVQKVLC